MKHLQVMIATLAIHILCISPLAVGAEQYPASGSAAAQGNAAQTPETASQAFDRMFTSGLTPEERAKANAVLEDAHGFVVLPNVLKVSMGLTQIQGRGVLIHRAATGAWQPPIPVLVSGQGVGPYFGLIAYDALIPIMKQMSLNEPLPAQKLIEKVNKVSGRAPLATLLIDATIIKCAVGKGERV